MKPETHSPDEWLLIDVAYKTACIYAATCDARWRAHLENAYNRACISSKGDETTAKALVVNEFYSGLMCRREQFDGDRYIIGTVSPLADGYDTAYWLGTIVSLKRPKLDKELATAFERSWTAHSKYIGRRFG